MITKNKTANQLTALKEWSQNPAAYQKKLADKKLIKWALEESPEPIVKNPAMKKAISDAEIQKRLDKARGPSDWDIIYQSMTPIEKGQWNAEKRKKGMNGKTAELINQPKLEKPKKKKPTTEPVKINFDIDPSLTAGLWSNVVKPTITNPTATAAELSSEGIMEAINLLQSSGMFKKGGKIK